MEGEFQNKKRERSESNSSEKSENENHKRVNMPKKANHRMHAHCNPLAEITIPYPITPSSADWSLHYPIKGVQKKIYNNTTKYPIKYEIQVYPESSNQNPDEDNKVKIVDVGCGYGGLLFNMTEYLGDEFYALGMEIRDKVANFVAEKINAHRHNSLQKTHQNISIIKTNSMKCILNYFYKEQLEKLFFCFPDPHFKKYNHRKRIINKYLLNDYLYILRTGGKLYTITDVEELHKWHFEVISSNPAFKLLSKEEIEKDKYLEFMKNTDEARKVLKKNGPMYYLIFEKIDTHIDSVQKLYDLLD